MDPLATVRIVFDADLEAAREAADAYNSWVRRGGSKVCLHAMWIVKIERRDADIVVVTWQSGTKRQLLRAAPGLVAQLWLPSG